MPELMDDIHESPKEMTGPIVLLGTLSLYIWYTLPNNFSPMASYGWFNPKIENNEFIGGLIHPVDSSIPNSISAIKIAEHAHHAHHTAMYISILVAALGIGLSWFTYIRNDISAKLWSKRFGFLYAWSANKYYFDERRRTERRERPETERPKNFETTKSSIIHGPLPRWKM